MPIAPQSRISKTRGRKRRTHYKLSVPGLNVCSNCGEVIQSHTVCSNCGYYNGKQVKAVKEKKAEEE